MAEPVLKQGSNDTAVRDLQEALKALGHDPGPVDGVFGAQTETAVKAFQQAREIPVDGVVGRVTWRNIDEADQSHPVLKAGSTGLPVRRLQSRISAVGFDTGGVDGRFGAKTEAAVRSCSRTSTSALTESSARRLGMSSTPWRMKAARADPGSVSGVDPLAGPLPPVSRSEASPLRQSGTGEQFAGHSPLL